MERRNRKSNRSLLKMAPRKCMMMSRAWATFYDRVDELPFDEFLGTLARQAKNGPPTKIS